MRQLFFKQYGRVQYFCISNLAFMPLINIHDCQSICESSRSNGQIVISHLSNLSVEKGSHHFIRLAHMANEANKTWKFLLAGPMNTSFEEKYGKYIHSSNNLDYCGSLDSLQKHKFYGKSDYFVFLSSYRNEAQPLVLYECIINGVVPLATSIGEIADVLGMSELLFDGVDLPEKVFSAINSFIVGNRKSVLKNHLLNHSMLIQQQALAEKNLLFSSIESILSSHS